MKKIVSININGIFFHIDEDAYDKLQIYLSEIHNRFSKSEEGKEIISDIEARISELFSQKINSQKQVITIDDVDEIITIMGQPSDFGGEDINEATKQESPRQEKHRSRRIYRDPDDRIIGGVSSGLSSYFGLNTTLVRIIMLILVFSFTPIFYLILWIAIPKARTTAQKLEMKGEDVNISNIEKSIKEEFEDVKQNFKNIRNKRSSGEKESFFEKLINLFLTVFGSLFGLFRVIFGIGLLLIGGALLIGFVFTFIFGLSGIAIGNNSMTFEQLSYLFINSNETGLLLLSILTAVFIPLFGIILAGVKVLFRVKTNFRIIGTITTIIWIFSISYIIYFSLHEVSFYNTKSKIEKTIELKSFPDIQNIHLKINKNDFIEDDEHLIRIENTYLKMVNDAPIIIGEPKINILKNDSNFIKIIITKKARGESQLQARENASKIKYDIITNADSTNATLIIPEYFNVLEKSKWRNQELTINIYVPSGKKIDFDEETEDLLNDADIDPETDYSDISGKVWIMQKNGLKIFKD